MSPAADPGDVDVPLPLGREPLGVPDGVGVVAAEAHDVGVRGPVGPQGDAHVAPRRAAELRPVALGVPAGDRVRPPARAEEPLGGGDHVVHVGHHGPPGAAPAGALPGGSGAAGGAP